MPSFCVDILILYSAVGTALACCIQLIAKSNNINRGERDQDVVVSITTSSQVTTAEPVATVTTPLLKKTEV
jgi:hypothetical protein